jgi:tRNA 2-thiouridine synthesizing protein A
MFGRSIELSMNDVSDNDWFQARELDLTGLKCPMPALLTERALRGMAAGERLMVTVTDALAPIDLRHVCQRGGHEFCGERRQENGALQLLIRCGPRLQV